MGTVTGYRRKNGKVVAAMRTLISIVNLACLEPPSVPKGRHLEFQTGSGIIANMFTISRQFTFCYGHRLLRHCGKCANLHGHNGTVNIELRNDQLNPQGMVVDFIDVKNSLGKWIEETLDHRLILEERDPLVDLLRGQGEAVLALPVEPTAENLAKLIYEQAEQFGLPVCTVTVWETEKCAAEYRMQKLECRS